MAAFGPVLEVQLWQIQPTLHTRHMIPAQCATVRRASTKPSPGWASWPAGYLSSARFFFSGYFLDWSEHAPLQMAHAATAHEAKDCCADVKPGDMKPGDMKPGDMKPGATGQR